MIDAASFQKAVVEYTVRLRDAHASEAKVLDFISFAEYIIRYPVCWRDPILALLAEYRRVRNSK